MKRCFNVYGRAAHYIDEGDNSCTLCAFDIQVIWASFVLLNLSWITCTTNWHFDVSVKLWEYRLTISNPVWRIRFSVCSIWKQISVWHLPNTSFVYWIPTIFIQPYIINVLIRRERKEITAQAETSGNGIALCVNEGKCIVCVAYFNTPYFHRPCLITYNVISEVNVTTAYLLGVIWLNCRSVWSKIRIIIWGSLLTLLRFRRWICVKV